MAIISGRVAKYKTLSGDIGLPQKNIDIDVYWGGAKRYTTTTNEKGMFAGLVAAAASSNDITIKASNAKKLFLPDPLWKDSIPRSSGGEITNEFIMFGVGNRWLPGLGSVNTGGVKTTHETSADQVAMFAVKGRIENEDVVIIDKTDLATADLSALGSGVLFIGSDEAFDFNGDYDADSVVNVMQFVQGGGTVVTSGKSSVFPRFMGGPQGLRYYYFSGLPKPYGASQSISTTVSSSAKDILQNMHGQNTFSMVAAIPARDHSLISNPGSTMVLSTGTYVFESLISGPWGPELDYNLEYIPNAVMFNYGDKGGTVIYMNGEISLNHASGGLAKDYVDALIDPVIFKADDEASLSKAVGGEYGALGGRPIATNSINLKSVVYNSGITVSSPAANDDVSFVFTVTSRIADSSAPDLVISGDATLMVSLRNPSGEVVAVKQTAASGDSTLAFALSTDVVVTGDWKMVVENVDGFDGRRVVVAACINGAYNIGAAAVLPTASITAIMSYPRGAEGSVFNYQLGDGNVVINETNIRKLALGALVKPECLDFARIDDDLVVRIKGGLNKIKVPCWFKRTSSNFFEVTFANGKKLSGIEVKKLAVMREPEIDITPIMIDERKRGTDGSDNLIGSTKNEFIFAGKGDDNISGGGGDDVYYYRKGDGNDGVRLSDGKNVLRFHLDIESGDVSVQKDGNDMLFGVECGSVRIKRWFSGSKLTRIEFPDGTVWDARDAEKLAYGKELTPREYYLASPAEDLPAAISGGCNGGAPFISFVTGATLLLYAKRRKS